LSGIETSCWDMDILHLILFCEAQTLILLFILSKRKFRTQPNLMLASIFVLMVTHYTFFYLLYADIISHKSSIAYLYIPLGTFPPILIFFYAKAIMHGEIKYSLKSLVHLIPFVVLLFMLVIIPWPGIPKNIWVIVGLEVMAFSYLAYAIIITISLNRFYQIKGFSLKVFSFNKKKTSVLKLLTILLYIHYFILLAKANVPIFIPGTEQLMDIINLGFLLTLSYLLTYVIISEPKSIHYEHEKVGLIGFKKYDKSSLTRTEAEEIIHCINALMREKKPYLDPEFNLKKLSELSSCNPHKISEVLNGLIGQSFNDYINNYRIEEFKQIILLPEYKNYSILALAYEVGFNSKATFNPAFKKFTGTTPSAYIKAVNG